MASAAIAGNGGGGAHENRSPFLAVNFCIALQGVFPSRT
jgi:microcystin-dependent protein